jgi:hemoglobin/transferrin/lactoferrin receptor protein
LLADDRTVRDRVSVGADWEAPAAGIDSLELLVYGQDSNVRQDTRQFRDTGNPLLQWRRFDFEQRDLGVDLLAQTRATTGRVQHWLVYGTELESTRYEGQRDGLQTTLATGATTNVMLGENYPVRDYPTSTAERAAVFVQDELRVGRLSLIPALRFEHYRLDAEPDAMFRQDYPNNRVVNLSEQSLTRRLGLRWALSPYQHLFLQAAEGFRAPPFNDVNIALTVVTSGTYEVRPNPDLRPETSKGIEAGWRWEGAMLQATLSAFDNHYRDLIDSRVNLGVDPVSGATVFQSVNRARARIAGVEAEATARLDDVLPMPGWRLRLAGSTVRGEDRVRDRPLNSVDPDKAVLGIGYEAPAGGWGAELVTTAVDRMARVDKSSNPFVPPGYVVFDAYGWYVPWQDGRLNLALQNLGDHRHWDWSAVQGVAATAANTGFYSRPGFSVSVGITQAW